MKSVCLHWLGEERALIRAAESSSRDDFREVLGKSDYGLQASRSNIHVARASVKITLPEKSDREDRNVEPSPRCRHGR
jgi:hypothetical protein